MLMLMMQNQGLNPSQSNHMNLMLPFLLMDSDSSENTDQLIMMMMQRGGGGTTDMDSILPFLRDDDSMDFKSIFLMLNMMKQDCQHETDASINMLIPLLPMDEGNSFSDSLMMMMMMQSMGNSPISMNQLMPFLLMEQSEESVLMMVLVNSITGGMDTQQGFDNNFNILLQLLLDESDKDSDSDMDSTNLMVTMMAMQSQAPNTRMGPNMMLPLLLMDDNSDNEKLMFYMMMSQNKPASCEPTSVEPVAPVKPVEDSETVFRTWHINEDGSKTLLDESSVDM